MLEGKFRKSIVEPFLKELSNTVDLSIQQTSIRGDADKLLCAYGFFIWMELKKDDGKEDKLQIYKASLVRSKGKGIAFTARPRNWPYVERFLTVLDSGIMDKNLLTKIMEEQ